MIDPRRKKKKKMDVPENGMFALANAMLTRKIHCVRSQVKFLLLIRLCAIKVAYPSLPSHSLF
mgnify:CR=1 FL=1